MRARGHPDRAPAAPSWHGAKPLPEPPLTPLRGRRLGSRARMHLVTSRWLAELRGDWRWEAACRAAMSTLEQLGRRAASPRPATLRRAPKDRRRCGDAAVRRLRHLR